MQVFSVNSFNPVSFGKKQSKSSESVNIASENQKEVCSADAAKAAAALNGVNSRTPKYKTEEIIYLGQEKNATAEQVSEMEKITQKALSVSEKGYDVAGKADSIYEKCQNILRDTAEVLDTAAELNYPKDNMEGTRGTWTINGDKGKFVGVATVSDEDGWDLNNVKINFSPKNNAIHSVEYDDGNKNLVLKLRDNELATCLVNKKVLENGDVQYDEGYKFSKYGNLLSYSDGITTSKKEMRVGELINFNNKERASGALVDVRTNLQNKSTKCAEYIELQDYGEPTLYAKNAEFKLNSSKIIADERYEICMLSNGEVASAIKTSKV